MWILFIGFICVLLVIGAFTGHPIKFTIWSLIILGALTFLVLVSIAIDNSSKPPLIYDRKDCPKPDADGYITKTCLPRPASSVKCGEYEHPFYNSESDMVNKRNPVGCYPNHAPSEENMNDSSDSEVIVEPWQKNNYTLPVKNQPSPSGEILTGIIN